MAIDTDALRAAIGSIAARLEAKQGDLNALDGELGDGDLGITLVKAFRELEHVKAGLPDDVGQALLQCASTVAKVSSSSFGTLLATGLIAAGKQAKGSTVLDPADIPDLMSKACEAMAARGRSKLGDKTVLDALDAAARVEVDDAQPMLRRMQAAVTTTMEAFRQKPNQVGRARIFAERSIGRDDPGMVAFAVMLAALDAGG